MKSPKRVKKILKYLDELEETLDFYLPNKLESKTYYLYFREIRQYINDLSIDKKVDHVRLAKKLKNTFKKNEKT